MADKTMSIQEKLAAARAAAGAKPASEKAAPPPEDEAVADEAEAEPEVEETEAEVEAPAPKAPLDRPLTLAEKLAAARSASAPKPKAAPKPAAKPKPAPAAAAEESVESEEAAPAPKAKPSVPLDRPLTMAEKLAAARGAAASPGAKPAAAKPAAAAKSAAPAAKTASSRELPPLEKITDPKDLAEAARRAGAVKEKAAKAAVAAASAPAAKTAVKKLAESKAVPPKPSKEVAVAGAMMATATDTENRRQFLGDMSWVTIGWGSFAAGMGALTLGCLRFMFPNVLAEPPSTVKIGSLTDFEKDKVDERFKAEWGFWVVRSSAYDGIDKVYALQSVCTHLGCPPNWLEAEQKFKCPCHGSGFYVSGVNFEGPAPRPLERFKISTGDDGQLVVDKSEKFQEELKQWINPDSFIKV